MEVREARASDRDFLIGACQALFEDLKQSANDPWFTGAVMTVERAASIVDEALAEAAMRQAVVLLALADDKPVGFLLGHFEKPYVAEAAIETVGHINLVRTLPEARGHGVARMLIGAAEEYFRRHGITWMQLSWHPDNRQAAATWERLGFEPFRIFGRRPL